MKKLSKSETKKQIDFFFHDLKEKNSKEVKKIKRIAASQNIPLKNHRKTFCKKCLTPYLSSKIRIKNKMKTVTCGKCGYVSKMKLKN